ncbi:hypothetical protein GPECTOR_10g979 [Gonium pectorale]|uniref:Uncharacterized protein n=1 Tax=Gonium pectorale TaxID=33097 RepID=A0A150GR48_GONPE|nr:hypothetical protein GPECTOR_10g979 [Gonium pectorale]|eukprot:KXZ52346.1 hypothetical protein GPECTOR_10g979 [Gonium pectorale]
MAQQQQQPVRAPAREHWSSRVWPQLPPELAERIVGCLNRNVLAATFRQLNKATAEHYSGSQHTAIHLSEPVPPHAFAAHWLAPGATRGLNMERRKKLVCLVAASGVLPNLEVALQAAGFCQAPWVAFEAAAGAGQLAMCQWLLDRFQSRSEERTAPSFAGDAWLAAAAGGHRHVCELLLPTVGRDTQLLKAAIGEAMRGGHSGLADWLLQQHPAPTDAEFRYLHGAAHGCDLPTLQRAWLPAEWRLHTNTVVDLIASAAGSPAPDWAAKVEWLEAQAHVLGGPDAAEEAAALPDDSEALARLTWLRGRGYPVDARAVGAAAGSGNMAALQYLLAEVPVGNVSSVDAMSVLDAAERGHLAALQALHAAGWPIQRHLRDFTHGAASSGQLQLLAWLLEAQWAEPAALDAELFAAAAESGSVELLAWLRQRGCPWDSAACWAAAGTGCEEALEWLVDQGCPMEEDGRPYMAACGNYGDMATVRCLRRLGVPWGRSGRVFLAAVGHSFVPARLPLLRCQLQEGCPVDYAAVEERTRGWSWVAHAHADAVLRQVREQLGRRQPHHG